MQAAFGLTMATWVFFYAVTPDAPLSLAGSMIVFAVWFLAALGVAKLWTRRKRRAPPPNAVQSLMPWLLLLLLTSTYAVAQAGVTLSGVVSDEEGPVSGAAVKLVNPTTGVSVSVTTDASGRYAFHDLLPGRYRLEVSVPALFRLVRDVDVPAQRLVSIDVPLKRGHPPPKASPKVPVASAPPRETARSFLIGPEPEQPGFGLYSYILFGSEPSPATRGRYVETMKAYLHALSEARELLLYLPPQRLNVTYLPLRNSPPARNPEPEWLVDHYGYARARAFLAKLPGAYRQHGPYIVSTLTPLGRTERLDGMFLYQDLSTVPPSLILPWIREFISQAARERFWEERALSQWVLELRTGIERCALALPDVTRSAADWKNLLATLIIQER